MKNRSPVAVFLLPFVTFGIYSLYWSVKTKGEMNSLGSNIPTAWLLIIPFVNIWWLWKYSEGVEQVTGAKISGVLAFILLWLLGFIGEAIIQDSFNKVATVPAQTAAAPAMPVPGATSPTPEQASTDQITPPEVPTPPTPTVSG